GFDPERYPAPSVASLHWGVLTSLTVGSHLSPLGFRKIVAKKRGVELNRRTSQLLPGKEGGLIQTVGSHRGFIAPYPVQKRPENRKVKSHRL
ncbi:MAG: hypothetical protein LUE93_03115, partial [Bacteroides sp.]|nr:hypothetical protein [Bacteroides sp.]